MSRFDYDEELRRMQAQQQGQAQPGSSPTAPPPPGGSPPSDPSQPGSDPSGGGIGRALEKLGQILGGVLGGLAHLTLAVPVQAGLKTAEVGATGTAGAAKTADAALKTPAKALEGLAAVVEKVVRVFEPLTKTTESLGKVSKSLVGPFDKLLDGLKKASAPMEKFVEAFNPALIELVNLAFRDLTAVIGQAFGPALVEIFQTVQEVAAALKPVFAAFAPAFATLFDAIGDIVSILMKALQPAFEVLATVFQVVAELFKSLITILTPIFVVLKAIFAILGPMIQGMLAALMPIIQFFTRAIMLATAALMKFAGATEMLQDMADMIDPKKEAERERLQGFAAVRNVAFTDPIQFGKQIVTAAAAAGIQGGNQKKSTEEWLERLAEDVRQIQKGNFDSLQELKREILEGLRKLGEYIVTGGAEAVYDVATNATQPVAAPVGFDLGARTWVDRAADWWYGNK